MNVILPPAILGMLGGGQLGRFFVRCAHELGYQVWVLDPDPLSPAGRIADKHLCAAFDDRVALAQFADACEVVTTEFENVPAETLRYLAQKTRVHPGAHAVEVCQNRIAEKKFLREHAIPCGEHWLIKQAEDLDQLSGVLFPAILKVAQFGYDGKGQIKVDTVEQLRAAFAEFGEVPCVLEKMLTLEAELSVVLARDATGEVACFPVVENYHTHGILDVSVSPSALPPVIQEQAIHMACVLAAKLAFVGTLAVEFFVEKGEVLVNEIAPRPHNSGHFTLDACSCNQFEQQVRAVVGLPLGVPHAHQAAAMVNLLGDLWQQQAPDWVGLHGIAGLTLHLYGKHEARVGRKMGHFTVLADNRDIALQQALKGRRLSGLSEDIVLWSANAEDVA